MALAAPPGAPLTSRFTAWFTTTMQSLLTAVLDRLAIANGAAPDFPVTARQVTSLQAQQLTLSAQQAGRRRTLAIANPTTVTLWVDDNSGVTAGNGWPIFGGTKEIFDGAEFSGPLWGIFDTAGSGTVFVLELTPAAVT